MIFLKKIKEIRFLNQKIKSDFFYFFRNSYFCANVLPNF